MGYGALVSGQDKVEDKVSEDIFFWGKRSLRHRRNSFGMGIDVHGLAAEKTDERFATLTGKFDRQAGRGGYDRNPRGQCLLHNFERSTATDQQNVRVEGEPVFLRDLRVKTVRFDDHRQHPMTKPIS